MSYREKYLKYKTKYLKLRQQGGGCDDIIITIQIKDQPIKYFNKNFEKIILSVGMIEYDSIIKDGAKIKDYTKIKDDKIKDYSKIEFSKDKLKFDNSVGPLIDEYIKQDINIELKKSFNEKLKTYFDTVNYMNDEKVKGQPFNEKLTYYIDINNNMKDININIYKSNKCTSDIIVDNIIVDNILKNISKNSDIINYYINNQSPYFISNSLYSNALRVGLHIPFIYDYQKFPLDDKLYVNKLYVNKEKYNQTINRNGKDGIMGKESISIDEFNLLLESDKQLYEPIYEKTSPFKSSIITSFVGTSNITGYKKKTN
jgi:hypothetical protein